jgi:hypothetical protein
MAGLAIVPNAAGSPPPDQPGGASLRTRRCDRATGQVASRADTVAAPVNGVSPGCTERRATIPRLRATLSVDHRLLSLRHVFSAPLA